MKIVETLCVNISAQILILPIMILNFNKISLIGILPNLIAVPISGIITISRIYNIFYLPNQYKFIKNIFWIDILFGKIFNKYSFIFF